jgi:uncharacterized membrane protein
MSKRNATDSKTLGCLIRLLKSASIAGVISIIISCVGMVMINLNATGSISEMNDELFKFIPVVLLIYFLLTIVVFIATGRKKRG